MNKLNALGLTICFAIILSCSNNRNENLYELDYVLKILDQRRGLIDQKDPKLIYSVSMHTDSMFLVYYNTLIYHSKEDLVAALKKYDPELEPLINPNRTNINPWVMIKSKSYELVKQLYLLEGIGTIEVSSDVLYWNHKLQ